MNWGGLARLTCRPIPRKEPPQWRRERHRNGVQPTNDSRLEALRAGRARVRDTPLAGRRVGRHHRRPDRPRRRCRRQFERVRDPGRTRRATDLIETRVRGGAGRRARLVFAAPPGERLDTAERREAIEDGHLETDEFAPSEDEAGIESVGDPFDENTFSTTAASPTRRLSSTGSSTRRTRRPCWPSRSRFARRSSRSASLSSTTATPSSRRSSRAQELLGLPAALIVLLVVFRTFVAMFIPIVAGARRLMTAFLLLLHPRRLDRHQHDHAAARPR